MRLTSFRRRWKPRLGIGDAESQAPDWGNDSESKWSFSLFEVWWPRRLEKATSSSASWILCCVYWIISRFFSSSTVSLKIWWSVIYSLVFPTKASGCDIDPTFAAFNWSPACLFPTPVLLIVREACFQALTLIAVPNKFSKDVLCRLSKSEGSAK